MHVFDEVCLLTAWAIINRERKLTADARDYIRSYIMKLQAFEFMQ